MASLVVHPKEDAQGRFGSRTNLITDWGFPKFSFPPGDPEPRFPLFRQVYRPRLAFSQEQAFFLGHRWIASGNPYCALFGLSIGQSCQMNHYTPIAFWDALPLIPHDFSDIGNGFRFVPHHVATFSIPLGDIFINSVILADEFGKSHVL